MASTEIQSKQEHEPEGLPVVRVRSTGEWAGFETGYVLQAITEEVEKIKAARGLATEEVLVSGVDASTLEADGGFQGRKQRVINAVPLGELPAIMTHTNGDGRADTRNPWSFATEGTGDPGLVLLDRRQLMHAEDHPDFRAHYEQGAPLPEDLDDSRPDDMWVTPDDGPLDAPQNHAVVAVLHFESNQPDGPY